MQCMAKHDRFVDSGASATETGKQRNDRQVDASKRTIHAGLSAAGVDPKIPEIMIPASTGHDVTILLTSNRQ